MGRGGRRPGSGRKPEADAPREHIARVPLSPAEHAELTGALGPKQTLAGFLRDEGLAAARRRLT